MNIKRTLIYFLVLALVVGEGYLIISLALEGMNQEKAVQTFCNNRCSYNPNSSFWEFAGDYSTKGFTTQDECFNYCSKVKMGLAYQFLMDSYKNSASLLDSIYGKLFSK